MLKTKSARSASQKTEDRVAVSQNHSRNHLQTCLHTRLRTRLFRLLALGSLFAAASFALAQEPFPGEPAQPPAQSQSQSQPEGQPPGPPQHAPLSVPDSAYQAPTIRVTTNVVLVPTLVEKSDGEVIYGLQSKDFTLLDNGVPQKVRVDDDMDTQPVSLVICVERGRDAALEFSKISHLGSLLQLFTGQGHGEVALVAFDSQPEYLDQFSQDTTYIEEDLARLPPGDGGAAIMDAVGFSEHLLESRPPDHRRVLLLISESRDHGSHKVTIPQLVQRIGVSNTLVLSLVFSPSKAELIDWARGNTGGGSELNILAPLMMTMNAMRRNTPRTLAEMSGGEYAPFTKDKGFQDRVAEEASHARNRYILSFHPSDLTPGLHSIQVKLTEDYGAHIVARASYWAVNADSQTPAPSPVPAPETPPGNN
nr:VWA domain-containing protein [Paracidobacterium acidisoli]